MNNARRSQIVTSSARLLSISLSNSALGKNSVVVPTLDQLNLLQYCYRLDSQTANSIGYNLVLESPGIPNEIVIISKPDP